MWSGVWLHLVQGDGALSLSQAFSECRAGGRRSSTSTAERWLMNYSLILLFIILNMLKIFHHKT